MPGLMDMHVHLAMQQSERSNEERFQLNPPDYAFRMTRYAERTLLAGFTTVRDLGTYNGLSISLKRAIEQGYVTGPRMWNAGKSIATTGGHADPTNGVREGLLPDPGPEQGVVNSPEEARKAVRQRYKEGSDLIKITATGGVLSIAPNGDNPQFTEDEIRAVVETAKDYGFHVAAHAHGAEGMKRALRAGVLSIEHGTLMDDEVIALLKQKGAWFVPTILAGKTVAERAKIEGFYHPLVRPKAARLGPLIQDTFAKAWKAGVKIAFGTDTGVSVHGENAKEFVYMVEAGMPTLVAIQSATWNTAQLLGVTSTLGAIEAGKFADIVAVPGNPESDINKMLQVAFVMKNGVVYKGPQ
jgi:imidazolonepropionase-like amidohydrolase